MSDYKSCSGCNQIKDLSLFYACAGKYRSECKKCTIKRNVRYQRRVQSWKYRYFDDDARRAYMREYYSQNKEKFARYRSEFKERFPEYYKEYFRRRKEK